MRTYSPPNVVVLIENSLYGNNPYPFLGGAAAFIITSVLAMLIDLIFVILQRYNRPMLVRVMERFEKLK